MKVSVFSSKNYDKKFLIGANKNSNHEITFFDEHLKFDTTPLVDGAQAVCVFVNDKLDETTIEKIAARGVKYIALRCSGFNNVDLAAAKKYNITVVRVPAYSPHAVAEHTVAMMLSLNRQIHRAHARVREGNFSLDGLLGFDMNGLTVGVIGTGKIGRIVAKIMHGFGCKILGYDLYPAAEVSDSKMQYVELDTLLGASDVVTLHCPLTPQTYHLINASSLEKMKKGVMLINTGRGALIDASAVTQGLKSGKIGYLGLDVYEEEADLFFEDLSNNVIQDDVFARLLTFPNVIITGHQAFFTADALTNIAETTLGNLSDLEKMGTSPNIVT
jgi:D-lactate dehydrogenase